MQLFKLQVVRLQARFSQTRRPGRARDGKNIGFQSSLRKNPKPPSWVAKPSLEHSAPETGPSLGPASAAPEKRGSMGCGFGLQRISVGFETEPKTPPVPFQRHRFWKNQSPAPLRLNARLIDVVMGATQVILSCVAVTDRRGRVAVPDSGDRSIAVSGSLFNKAPQTAPGVKKNMFKLLYRWVNFTL